MQLENWPKFIYACLACLCMTILMVAEVVTSEVGVPFLTAIAGYMLGNGVRAVKQQPDQPIFQPYGRRETDNGRNSSSD